MGGDGGSIPGRRDLVVTKEKAPRKDKDADLAAKWRLCAISQEPLRKPIVACGLGRLYNKETILEFLLDRDKFTCSSSFSHIRSLKDVKELKLHDNPEATAHPNASEFICSIVGIEMNGRHKFCFSLKCGCVLSERAVKTLQKDDKCCQCGEPYCGEELVVLNAEGEDLERQLEILMKRKEKQRAKKRKSLEKMKAKSKKKKETDDDKKTIQDDPTKTRVFKSLFTTSETAKKQPTAHWVTFNPQYF